MSNRENENASQQTPDKENIKHGVVTVNDENNPSPEQRDEAIRDEPDTERLRSEKQSVEEGARQSGNE
jgi:hypothetical protein